MPGLRPRLHRLQRRRRPGGVPDPGRRRDPGNRRDHRRARLHAAVLGASGLAAARARADHLRAALRESAAAWPGVPPARGRRTPAAMIRKLPLTPTLIVAAA